MNKTEKTTTQNLENLVNKPYLYGFSTKIETETIPFGLSENTVNLISQKKEEPSFLLNFRLRAGKLFTIILFFSFLIPNLYLILFQ